MSITASDLKVYSGASVPEDDTSTSGGAIDTATVPQLTQLPSNDALEMVSDNAADTMNVTITYRDVAGAKQTETAALNGTTVVSFANTKERVLKIVLASAATGTVTVRLAGGGATVATIDPGVTKVHIMFQNSASEAAETKRYEKRFWKNENGTNALADAEVTLTADPSANFMIALAGTKDDSGSVANRATEPTGLTWVDDNVAVAVPTDSLGAGEAIGEWIQQTLAAEEAAAKTTFTTSITGKGT